MKLLKRKAVGFCGIVLSVYTLAIPLFYNLFTSPFSWMSYLYLLSICIGFCMFIPHIENTLKLPHRIDKFLFFLMLVLILFLEGIFLFATSVLMIEKENIFIYLFPFIANFILYLLARKKRANETLWVDGISLLLIESIHVFIMMMYL